MCHAYRAHGLPPIVRIPAPDPYQACMAIDGGAAGIVAPYVETVAQARALVGAVKFRPLKGQRLERYLAGDVPLEPPLTKYLEHANAGNILVLNIESVPAIEALDEIVSVPGVDAVLIGPHDLSCSLGLPEQYDHPDFEQAVRTIFRKARAKGVGAGIHSWMGVERELAWFQAGANLLIHEADIRTFCSGVRRDVQRLRQATGDTAETKLREEEAI
jgi:4-hydroxy-2-oxoheptanedioate aldolase